MFKLGKALLCLGVSILFAYFNADRGRGFKIGVQRYASKAGTFSIFFLLTFIVCTSVFSFKDSLIYASVLTLCDVLILSVGWGKYFPHTLPTWREKEFPLVDYLANKTVGRYDGRVNPSDFKFIITWKVVAMTYRFLILSIPLIMASIWITRSWLSLVTILHCLLGGCIYWAGFEVAKRLEQDENNVLYSEILWGFLLGSSRFITLVYS